MLLLFISRRSCASLVASGRLHSSLGGHACRRPNQAMAVDVTIELPKVENEVSRV